jgi:predicted DNA-binding protein (UPF0251 family)
MTRPPKRRRVEFLPIVNYFKPAGIPLRTLEDIRLSVEEAEAVRLKDLESLEQEQGAKRMNISRPTFQRVLAAARQKVADALLNGKAIRIEGGNFKMAPRRFRCHNGHEWDIPLETATGANPVSCPACRTNVIFPLQPINSRHRKGKAY